MNESVFALPPMMMFVKRPTKSFSGWQRLFLIVYFAIGIVFFILGDFGLSACYALLGFFFSLNNIDLDLFAPMSMIAHGFGIYFLLPLSFVEDRSPMTLAYIFCTLIVSLVLYLTIPRLNFGISRRLGEGLILRKSSLRTIRLMQIVGLVGFFISTRLAGYSNPFSVFAEPLQYRFFMMIGGMTYFAELLNFFIVLPSIVVAVAYYLKKASCAMFLTTICLAAAYSLATGARGNLITLVLQLLLVRQMLYRRVKCLFVLFLGCVIIPFIAISGQYRSLKYIDENVSLQDVVSQITFQDAVKLAFSRFDAARMFDEFMKIDCDKEPKMGMSYAEMFIQVVPRTFWADKPRMPNPEMTRIIGRDDSDLDIAFDFGIFGETFLNFSWCGIFFGGIIIAVIGGSFQCMYDYAVSKRNPLIIISISLLCFFPLGLVVSGLAQVSLLCAFVIFKVLVLRKLFFYKPSAYGHFRFLRLVCLPQGRHGK